MRWNGSRDEKVSNLSSVVSESRTQTGGTRMLQVGKRGLSYCVAGSGNNSVRRHKTSAKPIIEP